MNDVVTNLVEVFRKNWFSHATRHKVPRIVRGHLSDGR